MRENSQNQPIGANTTFQAAVMRGDQELVRMFGRTIDTYTKDKALCWAAGNSDYRTVTQCEVAATRTETFYAVIHRHLIHFL